MVVLRALLLLFLLLSDACAAERIPFYTYYADPPFAVGAGSLTNRLAAWLSERSAGRYRFEPVQLPRRRLNVMIEQPHWRGVVAWANPVWFGEEASPRQSWTRPYMVDANLVVSRRGAAIEYEDDRSLDGKHVGGVLGFTYPDLERLIKGGRLTREDVASDYQNLLKLKAGRVEVAFLQASSFPYFRRQMPDLERWAYIAPKPRTVFARSMFLAPGQPALLNYLNTQLIALAADPQWQALLGTCALIGPALAAQSEVQRQLCH